MNSLYHIQQAHQDILSRFEAAMESDTELTPEQIDALNAELAINADEFLSKAEAYASVISAKRARMAYLRSEADRLSVMAKREEIAANRLHEAISKAMQSQGLTKADLEHFKLSFRQSEAVEISNFDALPALYRRMKVVYEPDKPVIKDDLKRGFEIPGASLVVRQNLQIK